MASRDRDWDDGSNGGAEGSPDPETLYTKEYCIGSSPHRPALKLQSPNGIEEHPDFQELSG